MNLNEMEECSYHECLVHLEEITEIEVNRREEKMKSIFQEIFLKSEAQLSPPAGEYTGPKQRKVQEEESCKSLEFRKFISRENSNFTRGAKKPWNFNISETQWKLSVRKSTSVAFDSLLQYPKIVDEWNKRQHNITLNGK